MITQSTNSNADVMQALMDAKQHAEMNVNSGTWGICGFIFGIFTIIWAIIYNPSANYIILADKSQQYSFIYLDNYKSMTRNKRIKASMIGWSIWLAILIGIFVLFGITL